MKTLINFSLGLFLICLLSSTFSYRTQYKSKKLAMREITEGMAMQNSTLTLNSTANTSLPSFNNMGFKCFQKQFNQNSFIPCSNDGGSCTSQGIVMYGSGTNYKFALINNQTAVTCDKTIAGDPGVNAINRQCFTLPVPPMLTVSMNQNIPATFYSDKICAYTSNNKTSSYRYFTNNDTRICASSDYDLGGSSGNGGCNCYPINLQNITLSNAYIPIRIVNTTFQCIGGNAGTCSGFFDAASCYNSTQTINNANKNIQKVNNANLYYDLHDFYFNRWICPSESGLNIAVRYNKARSDNTTSVSCLGRNGNDCFYGVNADQVCKRVLNCADSANSFQALTCGTSQYQNIWFHNGFNTFQQTWCRGAFAWLRFAGDFNNVSGNGLLTTPDGNNACVPQPLAPTKCFVDGTTNTTLLNQISTYYTTPSNYANILYCGQGTFARTRDIAGHWCNSALLLPDFNGKLFVGLLQN